MDVQIPLLVIGRKMFRVMSTHYRTCGVTRLKIIILLSTSLNGSMRNIYRKCSGIFEIASEDENGNVTSFVDCTIGFIQLGGSHISVTWMHVKCHILPTWQMGG